LPPLHYLEAAEESAPYDIYRVTKIRFLTTDRKDTIIYNNHITISNIPSEAYEYVVNGKTAIEWIMDRYQVKTDKDSGITNDPNHYATESGKPDYILKLLLSVIAISVKTMEIVRGLPEVKWGKDIYNKGK